MENNKHTVVPYHLYAIVLAVLLVLTLLSIAVTHIELAEYTIAGALFFAIVKSYLVLTYFMHLKYDKPYVRIMVAFVFAVFLTVIIITFLDYNYR